MERRLNSKPKASLWCYPLYAPCYCPSPHKLENSAALIKLSPQKLACSQNYIYMQNPWRLLSWNENKTAEDEKITFYNIMKITHLEGIHLVRKVFFFGLFPLVNPTVLQPTQRNACFVKVLWSLDQKHFHSNSICD